MSRKQSKLPVAAPAVPREALPVTTSPLLVAIAVDWLFLAGQSAAKAEQLEAQDGQQELAKAQHRTTSRCADNAMDALLSGSEDHEQRMADLLRMRRRAQVEMWG